MNETRRQRIAELLREAPVTIPDLARLVNAPVKMVVEDLEHVLRSARAGAEVVVRDAECAACGFVFRGRTRVNRPSRCPRCHSEHIREAEFFISEKA